MKIPKEIERAWDIRRKASLEFIENDCKIAEFLEDNDIEVLPEDIGGSVVSIFEADASYERIKNAIKAK